MLRSAAETSVTDVTANHVELFFDPHEKESELTQVTCDGHAVVDFQAARGARQPARRNAHHAQREPLG